MAGGLSCDEPDNHRRPQTKRRTLSYAPERIEGDDDAAHHIAPVPDAVDIKPSWTIEAVNDPDQIFDEPDPLSAHANSVRIVGVAESHDRWGIWGFSVLEVPDGDYQLLARLRPIVATRRRLLVADGPELIASGLPLLPTLDHPHWTVLVSEPSTAQFAKVRSIFRGPIDNPVWTSQR